MNKKWSFWCKQAWVWCWFVCRTPTGSRWWLTERRVSWTSWTLQVRRSTAPWGISTWGQERASSVCLPSITPSPLRTFISTGVCWAEPIFLCSEFVLKYLFNNAFFNFILKQENGDQKKCWLKKYIFFSLFFAVTTLRLPYVKITCVMIGLPFFNDEGKCHCVLVVIMFESAVTSAKFQLQFC